MHRLNLHLYVVLLYALYFSHYIKTDHEHESCQGAGSYNPIVKVCLFKGILWKLG